MSVFTTNYNPLLHGAYAIEVPPPSVLVPTNTGIGAMVGQFDWGPAQTLYTPSSQKDIYNTYAPAGMNRATSGFLCLQRKAFPLLKINRILGAGNAAAYVNVLSGTSTMSAVTHVSGTGGTDTVTGTPASSVTTIEVDITTGGSVGVALFSWKLNGVVQQTGQTTASTFVLGSTGLTWGFGAGTYVTTDVYTAYNQAVLLTVAAKYAGVAGNSITVTTSAPTDSNVAHFNMSVSVTGVSGTTTDVFQNLNYSGAPSTNSSPSLLNAILTGAITLQYNANNTVALGTTGSTTMAGGTNAAAYGTFSMSTGSNGSAIAAADYVGTAGLADKGVALCETDLLVRHVFSDYPGASIQLAVNQGLQAHALYMGDRVCYINGPQGQSVSAAESYHVSNSLVSDRTVYCDPWVYINDEVTGAMTLVPSAPFACSVATQLPTSTSISWKNPEVTQNMLSGIVGIEILRGVAAGANTLVGICTFQPEQLGGFSIEAGVVTEAVSDPSRARLTRRRVGDLVATTFVEQTRGFIDSPNVPSNQNNIVQALVALLEGLKDAQSFDPNHHDHIINYGVQSLAAANTPASLANGLFIIPVQVQTSSGIEKLFLAIQFGESVQVAVQ